MSKNMPPLRRAAYEGRQAYSLSLAACLRARFVMRQPPPLCRERTLAAMPTPRRAMRHDAMIRSLAAPATPAAHVVLKYYILRHIVIYCRACAPRARCLPPQCVEVCLPDGIPRPSSP